MTRHDSLQLKAWKVSLPSELDVTPATRMNALPHRLMMHLAYWWMSTVLHRPFYNTSPDRKIDHVKVRNGVLTRGCDILILSRSVKAQRGISLLFWRFTTIVRSYIVIVTGPNEISI
jgi:hypothetical protein